jgi:hypothetical protein
MPPYDFAPGAASCVGTFIASSPARVSAGNRTLYASRRRRQPPCAAPRSALHARASRAKPETRVASDV